MNNHTCQECKKEFEAEKQLHAHIKVHDLRVAAYYQKHFPRYDKHDKKIIKFKNKKQYFSTEFNSRTNLRMWLKDQSLEDKKKFCTGVLSKRKEEKELVYSPCQVELRSIMSPPIQYYEKEIGDYYEICKSLGFKNKYTTINNILEEAEWKNPVYKILVDTREQKPLKFERPFELMTLKYGDYTFDNSNATCNTYIERKSLSDFIGTLSGGYERFVNEIKRAEEDGAYLVILVEDTIENASNFKYLPYISKKIRATPEFIFNRVRNLIQKNEHIQFVFVKGRRESARVIEKIFTCGCVHKKTDLQLAYDKKIL
tara:strand:+ start:23059 stop:23997 length:939 start_codon:yes stop_codon:yes gene_type:complete